MRIYSVNVITDRDLKISRRVKNSWRRRIVEPELLDALHPSHPEAREARSELDLMNLLMGNHYWISHLVRKWHRPGWRLLELGAGSGALGRKLSHGFWPASELIGMDVTSKPREWPDGATWVMGNILQDAMPEAEIVVANLLFHQFNHEELKEIGRRLPERCRLLISVDPSRRFHTLWLGRAVAFLARLNRVTIHDMILSVHAGFRGGELPDGLRLRGWNAKTRSTLRGGYRMQAERRFLEQKP
jgi:hypothetical protein